MNKNNLDGFNVSTGGHNVRYNTDGKQTPEVQLNLNKATGDIKEDLPDPGGLAKASPKFEEIEPEVEQDEEEKQKSIAQNTTHVEDEDDDENVEND